MQIAAIASGITLLSNKEVEVCTQKLFFDIAMPDVQATTYDIDLTKLNTILTTVFGASVLNLSKGDGSTPIFQDIPLRTLAEISSVNMGALNVTHNGTEARVRFTIEISNTGGIKFSDNEKLMVNISGKPSLSVWTIYALDHQVKGTTSQNIHNIFVNANSAKDIDTTMLDMLVFPIANVTKVILHYTNGKTITVTQEELKMQFVDSEDTCAVANGNVFIGYLSQACLNVEYTHKVELTLDTNTNVQLVKTV